MTTAAATARPPLIRLSGIDKAFGDKVVFTGLELDVFEGETLAVLGVSGIGKSVMLKLVSGLLKPDRGEVRVFGDDIAPLGETALLPLRRRLAMLFQAGALFDSLSVGENLAYPLRRREPVDEAGIPAKVAEMLTLVGLPGIERKRPSDLSGGMRKRVALARAVITGPEVLLYDEPTTGLDPITSRLICDLIRSVQARLHSTSIVVTHDLVSAFDVADRVAMVADGRIVALGTIDEFKQSQVPAVVSFLDAARSRSTT